MTWDQVLAELGVPVGVVIGLVVLVLIVRWIRGGGEMRLRRGVTRLLGDGQQHLSLLGTVEQHGVLLAEQTRVQAEHGTALAAIQAQLSPNSGKSMHDVLVRIDDRTVQIQRRLDEHIASPHPGR